MQSTISAPISDRAPTAESLPIWVQREAIPFLASVRKALNWEYETSLSYDTTGSGAYVAVWTSDSLPTNRAANIQVDAVAMSKSGAVQAAAFTSRGLFRNSAGTVAQVGTTTAVFVERTDALIAVTIAVSGQTVVLSVKDNGVSPMTWRVVVKMLVTDEQ